MCFEALSDKKRGVILSTDICADCDDVGAVALLHAYSKEYGFPILGMINSSSSDLGTKTLYALNLHAESGDIPLGQWRGEPIFDDPTLSCYTGIIAEKFGQGAPKGYDSTYLYRRLLSEAADGSVVIITIGAFNDLYALMESQGDELSPLSGEELIKKKVHHVVSMACRDGAREFNVRHAPAAAKLVLESLPCPIYISEFFVGKTVITGFDPELNAVDNPYFLSYMLYPYYDRCKDASFDLTAVQFAVLGVGDLYSLSGPCGVRFFATKDSPDGIADATSFSDEEGGHVYLIKKAASDDMIASEINRQLAKII